MGTEAAGGILQGVDPTLGQQVLDEAVGAHVGAQRGRRGGLQSHGAVQLAQSQQPGDLARRLVGMIGVGEDPVGQQHEGATEAGSLGPDCLRRQKHRGAMIGLNRVRGRA